MSEEDTSKGFVAGAFLGALVGSAAALLTSPKNGRDMRKIVQSVAHEWQDEASFLAKDAQEIMVQLQKSFEVDMTAKHSPEVTQESEAVVAKVADTLERHFSSAKDLLAGIISTLHQDVSTISSPTPVIEKQSRYEPPFIPSTTKLESLNELKETAIESALMAEERASLSAATDVPLEQEPTTVGMSEEGAAPELEEHSEASHKKENEFEAVSGYSSTMIAPLFGRRRGVTVVEKQPELEVEPMRVEDKYTFEDQPTSPLEKVDRPARTSMPVATEELDVPTFMRHPESVPEALKNFDVIDMTKVREESTVSELHVEDATMEILPALPALPEPAQEMVAEIAEDEIAQHLPSEVPDESRELPQSTLPIPSRTARQNYDGYKPLTLSAAKGKTKPTVIKKPLALSEKEAAPKSKKMFFRKK